MPVSKYTPGPWSWAEDPTSPGYFLVRGNDKNVCIMQQKNSDMGMPDDPSRPEAIANARLIAAAPDLLAAAKRAIDEAVADDMDEWFAELKTAIAKAEGRTS